EPALDPTVGEHRLDLPGLRRVVAVEVRDRKSTRLNSSHVEISYAVFCLKKKKKGRTPQARPLATSRDALFDAGPQRIGSHGIRALTIEYWGAENFQTSQRW